MVYIKGLKFRGFKSFRKAEASFPKGYVCLAGPNGSGKSNVTDGIRFALGEGSLKALRAKRISELINTSSKYAEVTLYIDGERQYEIKRAINSEGKTLYRINGKRSTRTLVMEELRQYGLEAGTHNIIAQGQVQKIVELSSKERRQIIDGVAGISEFDDKKDEALSELAKVDQKINDANIVLGEREAHLTELEKEKNDALSYMEAQENFKRAKASISATEYAKLNKQHTEVVQKSTVLKGETEELEKQSAVLGGRMSELSSQRDAITAKISSSGSREAAMQEIAGLKESISSDTATLSAQKKDTERLDSSCASLAKQIETLRKSQKELSAQSKTISDSLSKVTKQIGELEKKTTSGNVQAEEISSRMESLSAKVVSLKEQKAASESTLKNTEKMLEMKKQEMARLSSTLGAQADDKLSGESSTLRKEALALQSQLDAMFEREREINRALPELDRKLLSAKEKAATLRAQISPSAVSMAARAVDEMKKEGMKGIYGQVSTLISCDPKYGNAVEAAAGQRLSYVVVDSMNTAVKCIEKLKAQKSGRCTFVPLDTVRSSGAEKPGAAQGCLGALIDFVEFEPAYMNAMEYVFSDTLLFDTVQNAKKAGVGKARMVSIDGELIEKSGIISGGSQKGSLLSKASLDKAELDASAIDAERKELYSQLYTLRDEMSAKRKEKAEAEIKLKGIEIEIKTTEERRASSKRTLSDIEEIKKELSSTEEEMAKLKKSLSALDAELLKSISEHESLKTRLASERDKAKQADSESNKLLTSLHAQRSSLEAQLAAKNEEFSRLAALYAEKENECKQAETQLSETKKSIVSLQKSISENTKLREEKEAKLSEMSSASQKLMGKLKELEGQLAEIAQQAGKLKAEIDRRARELMELEVKRQTTETRLIDLKADLDQYQGVPTIDATRAELEELTRKSQSTMEALGVVNLKAPELYDQKKKDIDEIKTRVASLDTEKKAVFHMMDEIEAKKRAIFLSTFTSVNDNFKRLFGYAFKGEATMLLEQPSSPFEGGLLVKVHDQDGRDKYLDSMSGGEKSLLALIFIFAIQMFKAAPFYILDEADAALDKENSRKLAELIRQLATKTQFIVVTHNDTMLSNAEVALGVTRTEDGSKIVGVQLTSAAAVARVKQA
ncbi:Chromosome partition protein Smc [uncultured archaeon]|nr:Chromosome partition protein Smc [uncultured archaeon]